MRARLREALRRGRPERASTLMGLLSSVTTLVC